MADRDSLVGKQIGNYKLVTWLGRGGFGTVYKGEHVIFTKDPAVAVKLSHVSYSSQRERDLALQEAQRQRELKHPYILPIHDAGTYDGFLYLVTEYAPKGSLRDRLDDQASKPLPMGEALTILSQIGQALQYLHHQKTVHCDLKPENILFNVKGEALLADFGLVAVLDTSRSVLHTSFAVGTLPYMAPEQFKGDISRESDQYALGCIAYELFTGRKSFFVPPVHPEVVKEVWKYKHTEETPAPPTQFNPSLPLYVEQAILKAMAKKREDRYPDVAAFIAALSKSKEQRVLEGNARRAAKRDMETLPASGQAIQSGPTVPTETASAPSKPSLAVPLPKDAQFNLDTPPPPELFQHILWEIGRRVRDGG